MELIKRSPLDALRAELAAATPMTDEEVLYLRASSEEQERAGTAKDVCRPGDLWELGEHRLACGSSTDNKDVAKLMGGKRAAIVITDPPYGVSFVRGQFVTDPKKKHKGCHDGTIPMGITGDDRKEQEQADFITKIFTIARDFAFPGSSVYMFSTSMREGVYSMLGLSEVVKLQSQIVWVKSSLILGQADYQWRHELIWYGWFKGHPHRWFGGRQNSTVLNHPKLSTNYHPNEKPVGIIETFLANSSLPGDVCYEPFAGSGSTLIACERTRRVCRAMELDPHFCDVVLARWAAYTGQDPVRHDGAKFSELNRK